MSIEIKMPALSPTMEKGTLAKWLVREGDLVKTGDLLAEIETDKATMEFEAVEEGHILSIVVAEGTDDVAVGTVLAMIGDAGEVAVTEGGERSAAPFVETAEQPVQPGPEPEVAASPPPSRTTAPAPESQPLARLSSKIAISPLAARIAEAKRIDISTVKGTGPGGRIVKADLGLAPRAAIPVAAAPAAPAVAAPAAAATVHAIADVPHELSKLSGMRKTIARRLTESKQQVPHIYLTLDIEMDALSRLRADLNASLAARGIKISVNDLMIKALALALLEVPECNVQYAGDEIARFRRADISVAVSIPNGLITPIIVDAGSKSLSTIAIEMKGLAARAREGRLQPKEYQGGTASLSNLGMFGIRQFQAVINPPQAMILAVGATEEKMIVREGEGRPAGVMTATGSFDHRAIDGADAARLMQAFRRLVETPMLLAS